MFTQSQLQLIKSLVDSKILDEKHRKAICETRKVVYTDSLTELEELREAIEEMMK